MTKFLLTFILRPLKYVICRMCGFVIKESRIRKHCPEHPTHLYLLDQSHCPNKRCKVPVESEYLREIPVRQTNYIIFCEFFWI